MDTVTRQQVVQACLNLYDEPHYLEIGVWNAKTFGPVQAARKVAVDPFYPEGVVEKWGKKPNVEMHEVTSDQYFGTIIGQESFNVIYLDGLHTFEQTLRDFLNSLSFIKPDGIIIIDDVYPDSYHGSLPNRQHANQVKSALKSDNRNWMGDVYRMTFFIDTFMQQFTYRMVSNNHGQLIIWRKRRDQVTERSMESVARAPFEQIFIEADAQRRIPLDAIIAEAIRDLGLCTDRPRASNSDLTGSNTATDGRFAGSAGAA